ncbi:alkaline phosphatase D family protein [Nonomuraea sp. SBT364]|uniref:alkaline phosphatase D family protein n=1 Tax=Nonomuraea sp. SBT364 TaxID=1580530 RepID=UPI00066E6B9E|nr:alkaline phosphatase D family protein [Nonomuraea sp. SBT364]
MANPFTLGVASGEPLPDGVILWTRLATSPTHADPARPGGMPPRAVPVSWQLAEDERFSTIVREGTAQALPAWAHSVHVRVDGLRPGADYYYRFRAGSELSPAGRTRTADDPAATRPVRFAVASCQRYEHGYYTALRHLAAERPDVVFHVGDYIYESRQADVAVRRLGSAGAAATLHAYRNRYARYKTDPDLRAAHAAAPWVPTWDDHEVLNNYRGDGDGSAAFLRRRAAAYQAYYEHQPLRVRPRDGGLRMYRRRSYGSVADFLVLDARQHRDGTAMLGAAQEQWLTARLRESPVTWRILVQPLFFSRRFVPGPPPNLRADSWDGHQAERDRIVAAAGPSGLVVFSGDVHNAWAGDLKADFLDPGSATVGAEFVASGITSRPPVTDSEAVLAANPHLRFFDGRRGYLSGTAGPAELRVAFRAVDFADRPDAPIRTVTEFVGEPNRLTFENASSK